MGESFIRQAHERAVERGISVVPPQFRDRLIASLAAPTEVVNEGTESDTDLDQVGGYTKLS